jgi:hypothetical protein
VSQPLAGFASSHQRTVAPGAFLPTPVFTTHILDFQFTAFVFFFYFFEAFFTHRSSPKYSTVEMPGNSILILGEKSGK